MIELAVITKISPIPLFGSISYHSEKKTQQSDSCLTFNSTDTLDPRRLRSSISNNNNAVDLDVKKREANEIQTNKDILLQEQLN